jgi:hypothetical protein
MMQSAEAALALIESDFGRSGRDVQLEAIRCELWEAHERGVNALARAAPSTEDARWAQQQRWAFIASCLKTAGFVNRKDLMGFFGISMPTASTDLQSFLKAHPASMRYNSSTKRYERASVSAGAEHE